MISYYLFWCLLVFNSSSALKTAPINVDVGIIGAGIGGLTSAAILSKVYGLKVAVYEAHYRPGGVGE